MARKIYVIDDDDKMCKLLEAHLRKSGFLVVTQSTPLLTDREIKRFRPDLVVLDVMMEWLSGDTIADVFDYAFRNRPLIVFFSAKSAEELEALAEDKGVEGWVCKSDGPDALVRKIRSLLPE